MTKEKIIKVIESVYTDDNGHLSFRNKTALRLVKENMNITYDNHWYFVKIYDDVMKMYCNQKNTRELENFAWHATALKEAKRIAKQHFEKSKKISWKAQQWGSVTIELCYKNVVSEYLNKNNIKYECNSELIEIDNVEYVYFNVYISPNKAKKLITFLDELRSY